MECYKRMDLLTATTNLRRYTGHPTHDRNGNPIKTGLFIALKMMGLQHYYRMFKHEEIDFVSLGLMNQNDFISMIDNNDVDRMMELASFFQGLPIFQQPRSG